MDGEVGVLKALLEAAQSLRTIAERSGRDEYLEDMTQVRGYAHNRACVAEAALAAVRALAKGDA